MFDQYPDLCECKKEKGRKLYSIYSSWIDVNEKDFDTLTPEIQNAWIMASNNKYRTLPKEQIDKILDEVMEKVTEKKENKKKKEKQKNEEEQQKDKQIEKPRKILNKIKKKKQEEEEPSIPNVINL